MSTVASRPTARTKPKSRTKARPDQPNAQPDAGPLDAVATAINDLGLCASSALVLIGDGRVPVPDAVLDGVRLSLRDFWERIEREFSKRLDTPADAKEKASAVHASPEPTGRADVVETHRARIYGFLSLLESAVSVQLEDTTQVGVGYLIEEIGHSVARLEELALAEVTA